MRRPLEFLLSATCGALALLGAGLVGWSLGNAGDLDLTTPLVAEPRPVRDADTLSPDERNNIAIYEESAASVVHITTVQRRRNFFSRNVMEIPAGTGSGFVWDSDGHVVTNFHVIQSVHLGHAHRIEVVFADQTAYEAELVGVAPDHDLAVLRIEAPAERLHPLRPGRSDSLAVGQKTFAIGNPFGLDYTLTTGIVSGLGREITAMSGRPIQGVIQTDAAINPGNSGGPLLDSAGRLIGVNTAIFSPSGASAGIGFAVPVDTVTRIVPQLVERGAVSRVGMGVVFGDDDLSRRIGVAGALILNVLPESPAAEAGLLPTRRARDGHVRLGDIVLAIEDRRIRALNDVYRELDGREPGSEVEIVVLRDGEEHRLTVGLTELQ